MQIKVFDVVELKNNNLATILEIKDNKQKERIYILYNEVEINV